MQLDNYLPATFATVTNPKFLMFRNAYPLTHRVLAMTIEHVGQPLLDLRSLLYRKVKEVYHSRFQIYLL